MDTVLSSQPAMIGTLLAVRARPMVTDQQTKTMLLVAAALRTITDPHAMIIPPAVTVQHTITVQAMEIVPHSVAQYTMVLPATTPRLPSEIEILLVATLVTPQIKATTQPFGPTTSQLTCPQYPQLSQFKDSSYRSNRLMTISSNDEDDDDIYGNLTTQFDMLTTYSTGPSRSSGKDYRREVGLIEAKIADYSQGYLDGLGDARASSRRSRRSRGRSDEMLRGLDDATITRYALNSCERFDLPEPFSASDEEVLAGLWVCRLAVDRCRDM
ncbi:MAG: hypothetical protein Q9178_006021 [Gyalolechia marmorata]